LSTPLAAVVIPAHDAAETIAATLDALARQDVDEPFELLVVDDSSTDATAAIAAERGARVIALGDQGGPAAARNAGAAATAAPILAFTDADCEPAPGWLREGLAALAEGADLVTGPIRPIAAPGPFDRTLSVTGPSPLFESANVLVRHATFDRVGGFRRPRRLSLSPGGGHFGEDVVFGWSVVRAGARVVHSPGALVHHAVFPRGARAYIAERLRLRFFPMLVAEVPELRDRLTLRVFLSPRTALFDLAFAGVATAAATRRRLPLLAAGPYLWRFVRPGLAPRRGALAAAAAVMLADLVGLGALVRGSIGNRTLLL
jgi:glycosyltransferase involved in cell wall biosynthesis